MSTVTVEEIPVTNLIITVRFYDLQSVGSDLWSIQHQLRKQPTTTHKNITQ